MWPSNKQWFKHIFQKDPIYRTSTVHGNTDVLAANK